MKLYPRGLLLFLAFLGVLAIARASRFGALAAAACVLIEILILGGIVGYGRNSQGNGS